MKTFFLLALLMLTFVSGCRSVPYQPPQRPTAGMFPTLMPASELSHFTPVAITAGELETHLRELSFWEPLSASQLESTEIDLVIRSLERRGYAELDSRRCDCAIHWVVFMGYPAGELTIIGETEDNCVLRKSWPVPSPSPAP